MKRKERKQSKSLLGASAAGHTILLSEIIGQPYGTPKTISPVSTTAQPNCLMSCNTTLFHQKSKLIKPAAASSSTSRASTKRIAIPSKKRTHKKGKNITQWSFTTVQTKFVKKSKPLTSKLKGDAPRADHFQPKQQRGNDDKQDSASLHITVSPKFSTLSLASKLSRTNKFFESMSQTKKETNYPSRKNTFNGVSSKSQGRNTSTSEINHKSAEVTKLPKIWNNISAHETFKQTGKALV